MVRAQQVGYILKEEEAWLQGCYRLDEDREAIARILYPLLLAPHAEGLAGWPADYNICACGVACSSFQPTAVAEAL